MLFLTVSDGYSCSELEIPYTAGRSTLLTINGTVGKTKVSQEYKVMTSEISQIFILTEKYSYLPGQLVQFRVLTLIGSQDSILYDPLASVQVRSPSTHLLAEWTAVPNPDGLLQFSFQLAEEVEEGLYGITVKIKGLQSQYQQFSVNPEILPRFAVTLDVQSHVLGTATEIPFNVCGKYGMSKLFL
ncbi:alpha-2-macroglobulin-like [Macrobrachium nipponense]|uniref:alpha-2-macroglobulin-like n=1 Tax=Macrobrachium nipponense TaxID=159736 RepID=UPI0030C7DE5D